MATISDGKLLKWMDAWFPQSIMYPAYQEQQKGNFTKREVFLAYKNNLEKIQKIDKDLYKKLRDQAKSLKDIEAFTNELVESHLKKVDVDAYNQLKKGHSLPTKDLIGFCLVRIKAKKPRLFAQLEAKASKLIKSSVTLEEWAKIMNGLGATVEQLGGKPRKVNKISNDNDGSTKTTGKAKGEVKPNKLSPREKLALDKKKIAEKVISHEQWYEQYGKKIVVYKAIEKSVEQHNKKKVDNLFAIRTEEEAIRNEEKEDIEKAKEIAKTYPSIIAKRKRRAKICHPSEVKGEERKIAQLEQDLEWANKVIKAYEGFLSKSFKWLWRKITPPPKLSLNELAMEELRATKI